MLEFMRKSAGSWFGVIVLGLALGALVITLFQPSGPAGGPGTSGAVLATVDKVAVVESSYASMVERAVANERERNPGITTPEFLRLGGGDAVLEQMIQGEAVKRFGADNAMLVSRRMVDGEIASIPALQVGGQFDEATFRRLLAEQQISEAALRADIASDLQRRQLLQPLALGTSIPNGMAEPFAALLLEERKGNILAVPSTTMPDPGKPTDEQLQAYYAAHARAYTLPERRTFRYAILEPEAFAEKAKPTAEEIESYYKEHPGDYGGLETRAVRHIVLRDEERAKALVAAVRGGASFADAAGKEGWAASDFDLGHVNREGLARETSNEVAGAAFGLKAGAVSDPVHSQLGYHVVQVTGITPPEPRSLQSVSAGIEQRLTEEKLQNLILDTVGAAEDRLAEGEALVDVARDLGLKVEDVAPVTADGRQYAEDYSISRFERPALLSRVFAAFPDDGALVADLGEHRYALFQLTDTIPPEQVPLQSISDDVALAWALQARSDAAKALAEKIAASANEGNALAKAAAGNKLAAPQELSVRRLELTQMVQQGQEVPPPVVMLLNLPAGKARVLEAPGGQGWFVVKVDAVEQGDLAQMPQLTDIVRQSMQRESADEMVGTFLKVIEREVGVVRHPDAVRAANRRLAGAE